MYDLTYDRHWECKNCGKHVLGLICPRCGGIDFILVETERIYNRKWYSPKSWFVPIEIKRETGEEKLARVLAQYSER